MNEAPGPASERPEQKRTERAERVEKVLDAVAARRAVVAFMDIPRSGAAERLAAAELKRRAAR